MMDQDISTDEPVVKKQELRRIITSGNVELDSRIGGGLPAGSLTLIEGASGSGKSVLSQQILFGSMKDGYKAAVFTSENTVKSLIRQMQSIDLDVLDYLLMRRLRVYPIELSRLGQKAPFILLAALKQEIERDLIIIDSFTSVITAASSDTDMLSFFEECKRLCATGTTIIINLHSNSANNDMLDRVRSLCDAHLNLRSMQDGQRIVKTLEVLKVRGGASVTGAIVGFEVEPGWGMRVIPISKARG